MIRASGVRRARGSTRSARMGVLSPVSDAAYRYTIRNASSTAPAQPNFESDAMPKVNCWKQIIYLFKLASFYCNGFDDNT